LDRSDQTTMSCWVVPQVAAELWGVAVQTVLDRAQAGLVASKTENGFTFIDVASHSEKCDPPTGLRDPAPPTYTVVTHQEMAALMGDSSAIAAAPAEPQIDDWRIARARTSRIRKPPARV
jgi:hypothetical protein